MYTDDCFSFIVTISAWTEPGCKDASKDPHASLGDSFKKGLGGFCSTKKAAAIFFWLVFGKFVTVLPEIEMLISL